MRERSRFSGLRAPWRNGQLSLTAKPRDPALAPQEALAREVVEAMGVPVALSTHWSDGGVGSVADGQTLTDVTESGLDVTLVDRNNYHLFQPLSYQVATGALSQRTSMIAATFLSRST